MPEGEFLITGSVPVVGCHQPHICHAMDGPDREENTARTIAYCLMHPQWCMSLQTHKFIGIR
jgi:organic radical activating enzyme